MIRTPEEQYLHNAIQGYVKPLQSQINELKKQLTEMQVKNGATVKREQKCNHSVIYLDSDGNNHCKFCNAKNASIFE